MGDEKKHAPQPQEEPLRHKQEGQGTHGVPTRRPASADKEDAPEGNGATGKPAAFPPHN